MNVSKEIQLLCNVLNLTDEFQLTFSWFDKRYSKQYNYVENKFNENKFNKNWIRKRGRLCSSEEKKN